MSLVAEIKEKLSNNRSGKNPDFLASFWKTRKGEYAEGDIIRGVTVPTIRAIAQQHLGHIDAKTIETLLQDPVHEVRLFSLIAMVYLYKKAGKHGRKQEDIVALYLKNINHINHRDLVDTSCRDILGSWLLDKDRTLLYTCAQSGKLRQQRIAIVTTRTFLKHRQTKDTIAISELLLDHPHDLIHKAVGWMLREMGKLVDHSLLINFLNQHAKHMPSIMRRYAMEHLTVEEKLYIRTKL